MSDLFHDEVDQSDAHLDELDSEALLRRAVDVVRNAKSMPLSASVLISRDEVLHLLDLVAGKLPDEMRQARWLLREGEEFMAEKGREADALLDDVRAQAERMVQRTEIVRQANQVAQRILDDANEEARRMRHEAEDYCDQKLGGMEIVLDRITRTVKAGREKLQATPPPPDIRAPVSAGGLGGGPSGGPGDGPGAGSGPDAAAVEDGFFDQDQS